MVQIVPRLPLPERVFSDSTSISTADSGYHSSITEEETREVCQKHLGRKAGSLGNFYNVSAHIFIFTFIFYFYCILFSIYALVKIEKMISALCKCSYSEKSSFRTGLSGVRLRNCLALVYLLRAIYRSLPVGIRLDVIRLMSRSSCVSRQHLNIR